MQVSLDRSTLRRVTIKIAKGLFLIPSVISIAASPVFSVFSLINNSYGRYCGFSSNGLVYDDGYECYLELFYLFPLFGLFFLWVFMRLFLVVGSVIGFFLLIFLVFAPDRLGILIHNRSKPV